MQYEETSPAIRWALYASGPDQASLDAQVQSLREAAPSMGLTHEPAMIREEIVSRTWADRSERDDLLRCAENCEFSYLLVACADQLSRTTAEFIDICNAFNLNGVSVHFMEGHPTVSLYSRVHMITQHKEQISQRIRRGLESAAREGRLPSRSASYGYSYDPTTKSHTITPVLQRMFEMAAAGVTPGEIAQTLIEQGIPTTNRRRWTSQGVTRILKNPRCTGIAHFMGICIDIIPIVTRENFERFERLLGLRKTRSTPRLTRMIRCGACDRNATPCLLAGMLRCERCGERMTSTRTQAARYYCCRGRDSGCDAPVIDAVELETKVLTNVRELFQNPDGIAQSFRRAARKLDGIDLKSRREALQELDIRVTAEGSSDGIRFRVESKLNPNGDGDGNLPTTGC